MYKVRSLDEPPPLVIGSTGPPLETGYSREKPPQIKR
jgi:hypothetical protein